VAVGGDGLSQIGIDVIVAEAARIPDQAGGGLVRQEHPLVGAHGVEGHAEACGLRVVRGRV